MVVRNGISRYHLCMEALWRAANDGAQELIRQYQGVLLKHAMCIEEHLQDMPEVRDWVWTD